MRIPRSGVVVLATALTLLTPVAAEANSYSHPDPAGDVVAVDGNTGATTPQPARTDGDILGSGVVHRKKRVEMQLRYAQLDQNGSFVVHYFSIATNKGKVRNFSLLTGPNNWSGTVQKETGQGKRFKCKGVRWSILYSGKKVSLSVPRRCLGNPKWVRVSLANAKAQSPSVFIDDANATSYDPDKQPVRGPRVFR